MSELKKNKFAWISSLVLAIVAGIGLAVYADQPQPGATAVQQAAPLYACDQSATATGAANTSVTVTTVTPPAGQFVYVCSVDIFEVANGAVTGAAGPAPIFSSTGLQNNLVWWGDNSSLTTGQQKVVLAGWPATSVQVKAASPATPVTIVTSAGQSTQSVRLNLTYRVGS